jgi:hypothetical protein
MRGQVIYNTDNWDYGFSTVVQLDDQKGRIINYCMKYITKQDEKIFGNYYLAGGNLKRTVPTEYANLDYGAIDAKQYNIKAANMSVKYLDTKD